MVNQGGSVNAFSLKPILKRLAKNKDDDTKVRRCSEGWGVCEPGARQSEGEERERRRERKERKKDHHNSVVRLETALSPFFLLSLSLSSFSLPDDRVANRPALAGLSEAPVVKCDKRARRGGKAP